MLKEKIKKWLDENKSLFQKEFPKDFVQGKELIELIMPGKQLVLGDQFFGFYQINDIEGETYFSEENYHKAKYIVYGSRTKETVLLIPKEEEDIKEIVKKYDKYLDEIIKKIKSDFIKEKNQGDEVVSHIFTIMNLIRL